MNTLSERLPIDRRQFLRVMVISASAVLAPFISASKPFADPRTGGRHRLYRGTTDGKLLGSANGQDWAVLADFGPHLTVREVRTTPGGWVLATLVAGGLPFVLKSPDGKNWYTSEYVAPGQV